MMVVPSWVRLALLNDSLGSAVGWTRARARVCSGIFLERDNRACRAASLADWRALSGGGEGRGVRVVVVVSAGSEGSSAAVAEDDWHRTEQAREGRLDMVAAAAGAAAPEERAWSSCPLHCEGRNLFMKAPTENREKGDESPLSVAVELRP